MSSLVNRSTNFLRKKIEMFTDVVEFNVSLWGNGAVDQIQHHFKHGDLTSSFAHYELENTDLVNVVMVIPPINQKKTRELKKFLQEHNNILKVLVENQGLVKNLKHSTAVFHQLRQEIDFDIIHDSYPFHFVEVIEEIKKKRFEL